MAEASIPVDLFNPGQVFACLGFLEAADVLLGDAEGGFDWSDEADVRFVLRAGVDENPFAHVLELLAEAAVESVAPPGSLLGTEKWQVPTRLLPSGAPYPFPEPQSPATLPAILTNGTRQLVIDYWGDATVRDNAKFWAGAGGYPGAALLRDGLNLVRSEMVSCAGDPFSVAKPQSSSFRFDWRRDYIPLEVGFSPNAHSGIEMVGYPVVETMAAIGLTNARPERKTKLDYSYAVLRGPDLLLPVSFHRAALGRSALPFDVRNFRFRLGWPGQENQARCIIDVFEELAS